MKNTCDNFCHCVLFMSFLVLPFEATSGVPPLFPCFPFSSLFSSFVFLLLFFCLSFSLFLSCVPSLCSSLLSHVFSLFSRFCPILSSPLLVSLFCVPLLLCFLFFSRDIFFCLPPRQRGPCLVCNLCAGSRGLLGPFHCLLACSLACSLSSAIDSEHRPATFTHPVSLRVVGVYRSHTLHGKVNGQRFVLCYEYKLQK